MNRRMFLNRSDAPDGPQGRHMKGVVAERAAWPGLGQSVRTRMTAISPRMTQGGLVVRGLPGRFRFSLKECS